MNTAVEIDTDNPIKITSEVTVRELVVGGSAASSVTIKAPLGVVGAMVLRDQATVTADAKVTVGGSLVMNAGSTLTHSVNGASMGNEAFLECEVLGDLAIEANAKIDLDAKGYAAGGPGRVFGAGGTYGGMGGNFGGVIDCYGSVFCPTNCGSAGGSSNSGDGGIGGGLARLTVAGTVLLDGSITAKGSASGYDGASGGAVFLTCGQLLGNGVISAEGADVVYSGGGGRVAVYLTKQAASFDDFDGTIETYPGSLKGAPGTVYLQTAADQPFGGLVRIVNAPTAAEFGGFSDNTFVQYPSPRLSADPQRGGMKIELGEMVRFSLTRDATVGELIVNGAKPKIFLNGHTLKVRTRVSKDEQARIRACVQDAGTGGEILWADAFQLIIR